MAGDVQDAIWPLPKFYFSVQLGDDQDVSFQEVTGLETENQIIEYRHGDSPSFFPIKMPGVGKVGNVTMKKGIFVNNNKFWDWYNEIKLNTIARRTVFTRKGWALGCRPCSRDLNMGFSRLHPAGPPPGASSVDDSGKTSA